MLGFFTLVSFAVAVIFGGWWWAGFALMFVAWGQRSQAKAKQKAEINLETKRRRSQRVRSPAKAKQEAERELDAYELLSEHSQEVPVTEAPSVRIDKRTAPADTKLAHDAKPMVAVNSAEFDKLLTLPGVGAAEAHLIIKRRGEKIFSSTIELVDYLELKPHIASRMDALIDFGPSVTLPEAQTEVPKQTEINAPRTTNFGGRTID